jgi:hypothetical protein
MTQAKKARFSGKTQLATKYIVSGADINGNRATDVKRRDRSGLHSNPKGKVLGFISWMNF